MAFNKIIIEGRLVKDPEIRTVGNELIKGTFTVAVNRKKQGEVDYFNVVTWNKRAQDCNTYLVKGSSVLVEGELQINKYNKDGTIYTNVDISANNVVFLSRGGVRDNTYQGREPIENPYGTNGGQDSQLENRFQIDNSLQDCDLTPPWDYLNEYHQNAGNKENDSVGNGVVTDLGNTTTPTTYNTKPETSIRNKAQVFKKVSGGDNIDMPF